MQGGLQTEGVECSPAPQGYLWGCGSGPRGRGGGKGGEGVAQPGMQGPGREPCRGPCREPRVGVGAGGSCRGLAEKYPELQPVVGLLSPTNVLTVAKA